MKKINILIIYILLISCNSGKEPDPCACKFNIDLVIPQTNSELIKYKKFFDKDMLKSCIENFTKNEEYDVEELYNYYHKRCPKYDLNIN